MPVQRCVSTTVSCPHFGHGSSLNVIVTPHAQYAGTALSSSIMVTRDAQLQRASPSFSDSSASSRASGRQTSCPIYDQNANPFRPTNADSFRYPLLNLLRALVQPKRHKQTNWRVHENHKMCQPLHNQAPIAHVSQTKQSTIRKSNSRCSHDSHDSAITRAATRYSIARRYSSAVIGLSYK